MFCSNCGSFVGSDEAFCPMCGTAVGNAEAAAPEAPAAEPAAAPAPAPTPAPAAEPAAKPAPAYTPVAAPVAAAPVAAAAVTKEGKKAKDSKPLRDPPGLWNNVGLKIKVLAKIVAVIGMVFWAVIGVAMIVGGIMWKNEPYAIDIGKIGTVEIAGGTPMIIAGAIIIVLGFLFCWIGSWMVYAYGDMADKLNSIEKNTRK